VDHATRVDNRAQRRAISHRVKEIQSALKWVSSRQVVNFWTPIYLGTLSLIILFWRPIIKVPRFAFCPCIHFVNEWSEPPNLNKTRWSLIIQQKNPFSLEVHKSERADIGANKR
jgi:hypothetical protein